MSDLTARLGWVQSSKSTFSKCIAFKAVFTHAAKRDLKRIFQGKRRPCSHVWGMSTVVTAFVTQASDGCWLHACRLYYHYTRHTWQYFWPRTHTHTQQSMVCLCGQSYLDYASRAENFVIRKFSGLQASTWGFTHSVCSHGIVTHSIHGWQKQSGAGMHTIWWCVMEQTSQHIANASTFISLKQA